MPVRDDGSTGAASPRGTSLSAGRRPGDLPIANTGQFPPGAGVVALAVAADWAADPPFSTSPPPPMAGDPVRRSAHRLFATVLRSADDRRPISWRRSRDAIMAVGSALQALADVTDARSQICSIVADVVHADRVVLFEPDGDGITSTASNLLDGPLRHFSWQEASTAVDVFRTQRRVLVPDVGSRFLTTPHRLAVHEHLRELKITSAVTQPVIRGRETVAVLSLQFRAPHVRVTSYESVLLDALAAGAATAIGRVDTVSRLISDADTDPLTGLANRRLWDERVAAELAAASRGGRSLTVALIDLDHFKLFNDRHGHLVGDELLTEVAGALSRALREGDLVARWGGEEFSVLLPRCDLRTAEATADRIIRTFPPRVSCSIGLAQWCPGESARDLIGRADAALLQAKAAGRGRRQSDTTGGDRAAGIPPVS